MDTLTKEKLHELKTELSSSIPPDIIAICEFKPKNYKRDLLEIDYKIENYCFEHDNLEDRGPTRVVSIYIHESLKYN